MKYWWCELKYTSILLFILCTNEIFGSERLFEHAKNLFEQQDYNSASKQFEILSSRYPQDQLIHMNAGMAAFYTGDFKTAMFHFTTVAESKRSLSSIALYWVSKIYGRLGKKVAATTSLGIALQQDNIPQGFYQQLLDLVEKFGPWESEFKKRADDEYQKERWHLALQFYRLAWVLNPNDEYQ